MTLCVLSSKTLNFLICKVENNVPAMRKLVKIREADTYKPVSWLLLACCRIINTTIIIITVTIILPAVIGAQITNYFCPHYYSGSVLVSYIAVGSRQAHIPASSSCQGSAG